LVSAPACKPEVCVSNSVGGNYFTVLSLLLLSCTYFHRIIGTFCVRLNIQGSEPKSNNSFWYSDGPLTVCIGRVTVGVVWRCKCTSCTTEHTTTTTARWWSSYYRASIDCKNIRNATLNAFDFMQGLNFYSLTHGSL